jgi:hypothetical protein
VSQAQTNQRSHFPHMWKLDLLVKFTYRNMWSHIWTYICVYMYIYMHTHSYIVREREQNCISRSERATKGRRDKMLESEKYWNKPSICEYNIMHCTVKC